MPCNPRTPRAAPGPGGFPRNTAAPLAIDVGVIVLVHRAQMHFQFQPGPRGGNLHRAPKPEHAVLGLTIMTPMIGNGRGRPRMIVEVTCGPAPPQTLVARILGSSGAFPFLKGHGLLGLTSRTQPDRGFETASLRGPLWVAHQGRATDPCLNAGAAPGVADQAHGHPKRLVQGATKPAADCGEFGEGGRSADCPMPVNPGRG